MERKVLQPPGVAPPRGQYSHAFLVEGAQRLLFIAGQVALDAQGRLVGAGDPAAQARQALENLRSILKDAGGELGHVVKTTLFLTDLAHRGAVNEVRREFFPQDPPPNSLLVVKSLANPEFLVEIEAIAALP